MKCILEYGVRGGYHVDNMPIPSIKLGARLAASIANSFNAQGLMKPHDFKVSAVNPRITWQSASHFVSLSYMDGIMRGPASSHLWRGDAICHG